MATKEPSARRKRKKLWWGVCAGFGGSILPTGSETVHPLAAKSRSFFSFEDTFPIMKLKLGDITKLGKGLISDCVCWAWRKSEISGVMAKADIKPKSMHYAKKWSDDVENLHRFQQAGYRDEVEYKQVKQVDMVEHWPETGFVKKLQRRDNTFYHYDKQRECEDREVHKVKVYVY